MAEALKRPNKNKLKHEKIALHNKKSKNGGIPRIEHLQGHSFSPFFFDPSPSVYGCPLGLSAPGSPRIDTYRCRHHLHTATSKSSTENSRNVEPNATTLTENTGNFPRSSPKQTSPFILLARIVSPHHTQAKDIVREMRGP